MSDFDKFDYVADGQLSLFDLFGEEDKAPLFKIKKNCRILEMFAGYGSQAMSLQRLGVDFEHYRISEWCIPSVRLYKAAHFPNRSEESNLSKEDAINELLRIGVSQDGKTPLTRENLNRKSAEWMNEVIADFKATNNIGSITNIHASDLGIEDRHIHTYIFCYSFPCQDISVAGLGKSLEKGSGTRSGLLWECQRILDECGTELPQVLLMENVKNLISSKHKEHFDKWCEYLESKGYKNFYKVMNAKNYGVAQNRERVFMVSVLGNYRYEFPKEIPLKKRMKDYLEDVVDKKYYITTEKARTLIDKLILEGKILTNERTNELAATSHLVTHTQTMNMHSASEQDTMVESTRRCSNGQECVKLIDLSMEGLDGKPRVYEDVAPTLQERDWKEPREVVECQRLSK